MPYKINGSRLLRQMLLDAPNDDSCIEWPRGKDTSGYGQFKGMDGKLHRAHREAFYIAVGEIPDGLLVLHCCDNPACFRPSHLQLGTDADNSADRENRGRTKQWGTSHSGATIDDDKAREILRLHKSGLSYRKIAGACGTAYTTVRNVITGKCWKHIYCAE